MQATVGDGFHFKLPFVNQRDGTRRTKACAEIEAALRELRAEVTVGADTTQVVEFARRYAA